jgi:cytochrome c oxidase subunit I+III
MRWCVVLALGCAFAAFALDVYGHRTVGLEPDAQAWSATVGVLLGYQGFHLMVLVAMSLYLLARSHAGLIAPRARATLDNTAVMWHCVAVQGIVGITTVQAMPWFAAL